MKLLHTSDWHLGQKFLSHDREEEHRLVLNWLLETIEEEKIDCLIVAGDIFDLGNPPNYARNLYYRFLASLVKSPCRHVVIIGGNHDSPSMLNAPKELLAALQVHVIGAVSEAIRDEIIELRSEEGELEALVAAVPFLRDRDLRRSELGETGQERLDRIKAGIVRHYQEVADYLEEHYPNGKCPVVATGHLYATGAEASGKQDNIYLGNIENIRSDQFPAIFDYVALGHIHRAQAVGGERHVRYCGSLIPLSFSETKDDKVVTILTFSDREITEMKDIAVPTLRRLKSIEGPLAKVKERLQVLAEKYKDHLTAWVEVLIETDKVLPNLHRDLTEFTEGMNLELLKIRTRQENRSLGQMSEQQDLEDMSPEEVFLKRCQSAGQAPNEQEQLLLTFKELQNWMQERE